MLPRQIARVAPTRSAIAARRLPLVPRRTFLPDSMTGQGGELERRYPTPRTLTDAEDPEMVCLASPHPPTKTPTTYGRQDRQKEITDN